jgi:hypothetical protein
MIVTDKSLCKSNMQAAGWALFCTHQVAQGNGDPEKWDDSEIICLDKLQVGQYAYRSN